MGWVVSVSSICFHRGNSAVLEESCPCSSQCPSRLGASKPQRLLNKQLCSGLTQRKTGGWGCYCEKSNWRINDKTTLPTIIFTSVALLRPWALGHTQLLPHFPTESFQTLA